MAFCPRVSLPSTRVCPASSRSPAPCVGYLEEPSVSPCRGPFPRLALWPKRTGHHFEILTNVDGTEQTFQSLLGTHPPPVPTTITGQLRGAGWWGRGWGWGAGLQGLPSHGLRNSWDEFPRKRLLIGLLPHAQLSGAGAVWEWVSRWKGLMMNVGEQNHHSAGEGELWAVTLRFSPASGAPCLALLWARDPLSWCLADVVSSNFWNQKKIFLIIFIYLLLIFDCAGSSFLLGFLSSCGKQGAPLSWCVRASRCDDFSCWGARGSRPRGLNNFSSWALECRLSSGGPRTYLLCGHLRCLPGPGVEPVSSTLAGGFFTTEPPGKCLKAKFQSAKTSTKSIFPLPLPYFPFIG